MDWLLRRAFAKIIRRGSLTLTTANGTPLTFGDGSGPPVAVRLADHTAELALLADPDMRLGELFMDGRFVVERGSIYEFVHLLLREAQTGSHSLIARLLGRGRSVLRRFRWRNRPGRAKRNVAHHYDLDGRLYELFLDADRQYSCAYFEHPDQSLEDAQAAKKRHIIAKLLLSPEHRVLDIGSGWGGLACEIGKAGVAEVVGVTLSEEQLAFAAERTQGSAEGCVRFELADYRSIVETFDRIVSVGMFEHVGRGSYPVFFRTCARLLAEDGVMLLHTIGCSAGPGFTTPWLDKYIFPGGYLPALSEILPEIERAGLIVSDIEVLRTHYAWTLHAWRERFLGRRADAAELYDERFCRMWEYYLAAAQVAFECEDLVVFQIQLAKQGSTVPITRDYLAVETPATPRSAPPPIRLAAAADR